MQRNSAFLFWGMVLSWADNADQINVGLWPQQKPILEFPSAKAFFRSLFRPGRTPVRDSLPKFQERLWKASFRDYQINEDYMGFEICLTK